MNRIIAIIFLMLAIVGQVKADTYYKIKVGGYDVKSSNASSITGDRIKAYSSSVNGGKPSVTYVGDATSGTLTLYNVKIERDGSGNRAILNDGNPGLTIVFKGENYLYAEDASPVRLNANTIITCQNGGKAEIVGVDQDALCPYNGSLVTITDANLTIRATNSSAIEGGSSGSSGGLVVINNSTVKCTGYKAALCRLKSVSVKGTSNVDLSMSTSNVTVQDVAKLDFKDMMDFYEPADAYFSSSKMTVCTAAQPDGRRSTILMRPTAIKIDYTTFPDEKFRSWVVTNCDNERDWILRSSEKLRSTINVNEKNISDLKGIEHFLYLTELNCNKNKLTSIDLSKNTKLKKLDCSENQLTSLDVSKNLALEELNFATNQLTSINVTKLTSLKTLDCGENQLSSINVSMNTALVELSCYDNQLSSLDISKNTALQVVWCFDNQLTSLDVSKNTAMKDLWCYDNRLTSLDVSKNLALESLICSENQLTSLDVSKNPALDDLRCEANKLTKLDVTNNKKLKFLQISDNQIRGVNMDIFVNSLPQVTGGRLYAISSKDETSLGNVMNKVQVGTATAKGWEVLQSVLTGVIPYEGIDAGIAISATNFPDANFRQVLSGQSIDTNQDGSLMTEELQNVKVMNISNKDISSLKGIEFFTALSMLVCANNNLTTLDLSKNTKLTYLDCSGNRLTSLDLTKNTKLNQLYIYNNNIKGTGMTTLVKSLPTTTYGRFYVLWGDDDTHNEINFNQVMTVRDKHWYVLINRNNKWEEYFGKDVPMGIGEVENWRDGEMEKMRNGENEEPVIRYNLSGQRVGKEYKGIVVVMGKKSVKH